MRFVYNYGSLNQLRIYVYVYRTKCDILLVNLIYNDEEEEERKKCNEIIETLSMRADCRKIQFVLP